MAEDQSDRKAWVTTSWDDGYPADLRLAELLDKYGVAATFYIPRRCAHSVMNEKQIYELSRRFEIGAHTLDHVYLDGASDREAEAQIAGSRRWIEDVTGRKCQAFCFPGGKYRKHQIRVVQKAGFSVARTTELLSTARPRRLAGLLVLPTTVQAFPHHSSAYLRNALRRREVVQLLGSGALFSTGKWVGLAERLLARVLRVGGVFHLWGHSWEIEEQQQWRQLERFLAFVAQNRDATHFVTNSALRDCREQE